jgi:hypothetical protein
VGAPDGAVLNGEPWPAEGSEVTWPTTVAAHLVACGVAEEVPDKSRPHGRRSRKGGGSGG